jgi:hypothetical protein
MHLVRHGKKSPVVRYYLRPADAERSAPVIPQLLPLALTLESLQAMGQRP